jgi:hypothetical protein
MPEKGANVELKTTTKTNELPMRPVPSDPWPMSRSMEDSVRSDFFKGGKDTQLLYVLESLYCGAWFLKLSCMYMELSHQNVFLDSNFIVKESNKCYHLNMISKHTIRNTPFARWDNIQ